MRASPARQIEPRLLDALQSGAAYERFVRLVEAQGGTRAALDGIAPHPQRASAVAPRSGVVAAIDAVAIGELARELTVADGPFAGIRIIARVGTPVRAGDVLAECAGAAIDPAAVVRAFSVADAAPPARPLLETVVRDAEPAGSANAKSRW